MLNTRNLIEVGRIVGEASSAEFVFISDKERYPPKYEYLLVMSKEYIAGRLKEVPVLAQVQKIVSRSLVLSENLDIETIERIRRAGIDEVNIVGFAKILGYIDRESKGVLMPRRAVVPGNPVYLAPSDLLEEFFSYDEEEGLYIGNLLMRPDVKVYISLNGLRRHLAILAQTGAGKSYTAGVLMEELIKKGATIVVIDPHSDYVFLSRRRDNTRFEFYDRITVFRNPNSTGRYGEKDIDNLKPYLVNFVELDVDEICDICGISSRYTNLREIVRLMVEELRSEKACYLPKDLYEKIEEFIRKTRDRKKKEYAIQALKYVRRLLRLKVFGDRGVSIRDILKPVHISVIDLSGLDDLSMDYITYKTLTEIYNAVVSGEFNYPVFIFIEEAHKFIPPKNLKRTYSAEIINTIASEGRKFGIFLVLISQRPYKLDPDSLSQCNSQIIMRMTNPQDQKAVRESSERVSEDLINDLPGLNPGEAIIVGEVTRVPVMVKIRSRETREGGADIDVVSKLKEALNETELSKSYEDEGIEGPKRGVWSEV
ncbi:MAG: ATP-binding protein [Thermoprotei archaeon]|nr:MAG: ATP-binding protein [Thermoprotei archaeon]